MRHLHQDNIITSSLAGIYYLLKTNTILSQIDGAGIVNSVLTAVSCYLVVRLIKTIFPEKFKEK